MTWATHPPAVGRMALMACAFAVATAACSSTAVPTTTTTGAVSGDVSLDAEFLAEQAAKVDIIDGAGAFMVAVVDDSGTAVHASAGSDADGNAPRPDDVFRIGSITKVFTATATLILVDEGLVDLDAPAADYVNRVPVSSAVTVRDLLGHTSGIPNYTDTEDYYQLLLDDPARTWTPEDSIGLVGDQEVQFEAGDQFGYSNTNYIVLGILIEEVTGRPYHEYVRDRIIDPLGMTGTYVAGAEGGPEPFDAYTPFRGSAELIEFDYTAIETGAWAAGAVVSSATDMHKLFSALFADQIISSESLAEMTDGSEYGLGIELFESPLGIYGHGGGIVGYLTMVRHAPETGRTAFWVSTNDQVNPNPAFSEVFEALGS